MQIWQKLQKIMIKRGISGLPVIELPDNVEQSIGIISKSDIVKALLTEEEERYFT